MPDEAQPATSTIDLAEIAADGRPVVLRHGQPISRQEVLGAAAALSITLPKTRWFANYCLDRYEFLVAMLAAVMRGAVILLPQDRTARTFSELAADHPDLYALVDGDLDLPGDRMVEISTPLARAGYPGAATIVRGDEVCVKLFTSGSTGRPKAVAKTWDMLRVQSHAYLSPFGLAEGSRASLVATVPHQHMYGFETTIMLSLLAGPACYAGVPLFPADVIRALSDVPAPRVLIATPAHLRALVSSGEPCPPLHRIICATSPLERDLALAAEEKFETILNEAYGATEAGLVATRRPAVEEIFRTVPHVRLRTGPVGTIAYSEHMAKPVELGDDLDLADERSFLYRGRTEDNVNVAGKRASLSGLNAILCEIDGVIDGAFFEPERGDSKRLAQRLVVFAVATGLSENLIQRKIRKRLDPAFAPRRVFLVERLPRNDVGKLTRAALTDLYERLE